MSGFKFNLKGSKVSKPGAGKAKSLFAAKKATKNAEAGKKKNVLSTPDDDEEPKTIVIDGFHSRSGAMSGNKAISEKEKLVIKPPHLAKTILNSLQSSEGQLETAGATTGSSDNADELARLSLLAGKSVDDTSNLTIKMGDNDSAEDIVEEDYENVPVEQFGAALLRGMGWKENDTKSSRGADVLHRQRGVTLGIGSTPVEKEIEQEIMGKTSVKLTVPMLPRTKQQ